MYDNQRQGTLELAYIGGLIDGEGSFMITRSTSGYKRKTPSYTPRIKIAMTDRRPLDFTVKHSGFGQINTEVERRLRTGRKIIYQWQIHSLDKCMKFAELILPYLVLKGSQAELMIEYCSRFERKLKCMDGVDDNERIFREESYIKMRKLNGKFPAAETKPTNT